MVDTKVSRSAEKPHIHVIAGPTGVGKSAAASALALETGAPVVVADRLQCFVDLATTSARAGADVPGVRRLWLGDRTVQDGDLPAGEAADSLTALVGELTAAHQLVIVEGGSISLLRELAKCWAQLPYRLSVRLLPLPEHDAYIAALARRALGMLTAPSPDQTLLDELATLWRDPCQRRFAASVNGFEAVLEYCAKYSLAPDSLTETRLPHGALERMAELIAVRHAEHGRLQHQVFSEIFAASLPAPGTGTGEWRRAA